MTPGAHEGASHWHASAVQLQLVVSGADTLLSRNPAATVWTADIARRRLNWSALQGQAYFRPRVTHGVAGMVVEEARSRAGRRQVIARHPVGAVFECIETG